MAESENLIALERLRWMRHQCGIKPEAAAVSDSFDCGSVFGAVAAGLRVFRSG